MLYGTPKFLGFLLTDPTDISGIIGMWKPTADSLHFPSDLYPKSDSTADSPLFLSNVYPKSDSTADSPLFLSSILG